MNSSIERKDKREYERNLSSKGFPFTIMSLLTTLFTNLYNIKKDPSNSKTSPLIHDNPNYPIN